MLIKVKRNWKDFAEFCHNPSRRNFLGQSISTGILSVGIPYALMEDLFKPAYAAAPANCPPPATNPGSIAQIFAEGGPTMGARFISEAQAAVMNTGMAANYGITGSNLVKLGSNLVIDSQSPFGQVLLQGPPGFTGGATGWQNTVLKKISGGGHLGCFTQDDGAGRNTGLIARVSPLKINKAGKDLAIGQSSTLASWANGLPATVVNRNNLAPASFANAFGLNPPAAGLVTADSMNASADTTNSLRSAFSSIFNTPQRKGASALDLATGCGMYNNAQMADPNFGASLFNPANITALTGSLTVAQLTNGEQAQLAAFYQSAVGVVGGVENEFSGRDYHGNSVQNDITPKDIEEARTVVMWLAACNAAQARGAMIYTANGQAIANGTTAVTSTINGTAVNLSGPTAQSDAGGAYSAGLIIFFDPKGAPPAPRFTGTVTATTGNAKIDSSVGSSQAAVAGLYLSGLKWINNGSLTNAMIAPMKAANAVPSNVDDVLVI